MDIIMNIFTIVTTLLNLVLCTYAAFKKENPTFSQKIALSKNDTIIISPTVFRIYMEPMTGISSIHRSFRLEKGLKPYMSVLY